MPSFTSSVSDLEASGPVVDLRVGITLAAQQAIVASGATPPPPIAIAALIDTGASGTVIQQGIAQQLGIQPVGVVPINTPSSHNVQCYQYAVRLFLPNNLVADVTAIEAPLQGQNIQGLIGRDLLKYAVLIYQGLTNQFTLSF